MESNEFVTIGEAATMLGMNRASVRNHIARGRLHAVSTPWDGRVKLISVDDLVTFTADQQTTMIPRNFQPQTAEEMHAAGWAMDYRRDHDGRLFGALPINNERRVA